VNDWAVDRGRTDPHVDQCGPDDMPADPVMNRHRVVHRRSERR
jgi:hypothetical protein